MTFTAPVQVGEVLAGKYRVERVLGMGGMGVVVAAIHVELHERRAIKFMLPQALSDPRSVERFLREARAAVRLKSEHVAKVYDVGRLDNGAPFIVMEYLDGADLVTTIGSGPVSMEVAASHVLQACEAIAEAHASGIVHRDLKPANLFLTERNGGGGPLVKVLDFGISKWVDAEAAADGNDLTNTTAMIGSPSYMSPEQIKSSKGVDPRTDIWSLGVILYQLVTGQLPFRADSRLALCMMVVQDLPPPPSTVRPELAGEPDRVIMHCLEKDRSQRYQNVAELAGDLAGLAPGHTSDMLVGRIRHLLGVSATTRSLPPTSAPTQSVTPFAVGAPHTPFAVGVPHTPAAAVAMGGRTDASWGKTGSRETARRMPRALVLGGAALIAAVAVVGVLALRGPRDEAPAPALPDTAASVAATVVPPAVAPSELPSVTAQPIEPPPPTASASSTKPPPATGPRPPRSPVSAAPGPKPPATAEPAPPRPTDPFGTSRK